ncbi:hypothetical protein SDC9_191782 [bioreactor metagenome]|uniref:Uncharacterized protein n=1 Tax=bioreactor metagenome TaxID=1076179 RepID=A0A645HYU2_9ZZZZ
MREPISHNWHIRLNNFVHSMLYLINELIIYFFFAILNLTVKILFYRILYCYLNIISKNVPYRLQHYHACSPHVHAHAFTVGRVNKHNILTFVDFSSKFFKSISYPCGHNRGIKSFLVLFA